MSMYAIATMPLLCILHSTGIKQVWFADDATGGGMLEQVQSWWDQLNRKGSGYGYHSKDSKSWLVVKKAATEEAITRCSMRQEYRSPQMEGDSWELL